MDEVIIKMYSNSGKSVLKVATYFMLDVGERNFFEVSTDMVQRHTAPR